MLIQTRDHLIFLLFRFAHICDLARIQFLRALLIPNFAREVYRNRPIRIFLSFILLSCFYFFLSLTRPDLLLEFGPFLLGYPHLIASYRYLMRKGATRTFVRTNLTAVHFFIALTTVSLLLRFCAYRFGFITELPFGFWDLIVAGFAFLLFPRPFFSVARFAQVSLCFTLVYFLSRFAWDEPLIFAGAALILHNWIAFLHWILATPKKETLIAYSTLVLFAVVHLLVVIGIFDAWMQSDVSRFISDTRTTGWQLASWTQNPIIWQRALVLYTFGLSVHYFVWLKAIPESLSPNPYPYSFRLSLENLRQEIGANILVLLSLTWVLGLALWIFYFSVGRYMYFAIATLHGWLEIVFLLAGIKVRRVGASGFVSQPCVSSLFGLGLIRFRKN